LSRQPRTRCDNRNTSESNVEIARRGYEAIARGDVDAIADLLDSDVKWHGGDPSWSGACHNRAEALDIMRRRTIRRGVGGVRPRSATGEAPLVANLTTFRDGKVIDMVHYPDPADALAAAGVDPVRRA
jgi:ketosteroid isomerase-like protein